MSQNTFHVIEDRWYTAIEAADLGVWYADLQAGTCHYSASWKRMLGYDAAELEDAPDLWLQFIHPDDRASAIASGDRHLDGETSAIEAQFRLRHKSGRWIWVLDRGKVIERDRDGKPVRVMGVQTDITPQKDTEALLSLSEERTKMALDIAKVGLWHFDPVNNTVVWDQRMCEIYGLDQAPGVVPRMTWHGFLHPDDADVAENASEHTLLTGEPMETRYRIIRGDGEVRTLYGMSRRTDHAVSGSLLMGTIWDITDQIGNIEAVRQEREQFRTTLDTIADAVMTTDREGKITFANLAALTMLQGRADKLIGQDFDSCVVMREEDSRQIVRSGVSSALRHNHSIKDSSAKLVQGFFGEETPVRNTITPIVDSAGTPTGAVIVLNDLSSTRRHERALAYAASHDHLTNLLNRSSFKQSYEFICARQEDHRFALAVLELDRFKVLDDTAGRAAGDLALQTISEILRSMTWSTEVVARLSGDQFGLLLQADTSDELVSRTDGLIAAIRNTELRFAGRNYTIGASVGIITMCDADMDFAVALARAESACHAARAGGGEQSILYSPSNLVAQDNLSSVKAASELLDALSEDRLEIYGQVINSLTNSSGSALHIEVLARLRGRDGVLLSLAHFIPAAERFGIMASVDKHLIARTLDFLRDANADPCTMRVAINLSANTLSNRSLWQFVAAELAARDLDPQLIIFEITETAAINNPAAAQKFVHSARAAGCRISLDDFGAGQSSYGYLERFDVDYIKIDGAFVRNLVSNRFHQAVVASICAIAKELEIEVIAECIETSTVADYLKDHGIQYGQGYLFHRPEPLRVILDSTFGSVGQHGARQDDVADQIGSVAAA